MTTAVSPCLNALNRGLINQDGNTGSGVYMVLIGGEETPVYCDMDHSGGGWMMVAAQFEDNPVVWDEGIQTDYDPTLATKQSFALNVLPEHTQTAFGFNLYATYIDYVDFV